jgi:hypothetical protein
MMSDDLMRAHNKVNLKLDFWKTRVHHTTPDSYLDIGMQLLEELESIEDLVNDKVTNWLNPSRG